MKIASNRFASFFLKRHSSQLAESDSINCLESFSQHFSGLYEHAMAVSKGRKLFAIVNKKFPTFLAIFFLRSTEFPFYT